MRGSVGDDMRSSEGEETYRLLEKGEGFRIGLATRQDVAEPPSTALEFLVRLFCTGQRIGPEDMERASGLVKGLAGMGYTIFFQDDGWISCERPVGALEAGEQARQLQSLLRGR